MKHCRLCKGYFSLTEYNKKAGTKEEPDEKYLAIDHCHESGIVRGLLCMPCNTGLGNFKDNVQTLLNAIKYLER